MNINHARCGCGTIVKLPSLKTRTAHVACEECHRHRSIASRMGRLNENGALTRLFDRHSRREPLPLPPISFPEPTCLNPIAMASLEWWSAAVQELTKPSVTDQLLAGIDDEKWDMACDLQPESAWQDDGGEG